MEEIWKDIEGYEGLYQVSSEGRVLNVKRNKTLKPMTNKDGYYYVNLSINGKYKSKQVHRLVALAFLPNPNNLPCVNHKSEIKTQNTVWVNEDGTINPEKSNLEWCTVQYNNTYGTRVEKTIKPVKQMTLDGQVVAIWPSASEAGRNGYIPNNIANCCNHKDKHVTHKGYKWEYV